MHSMKLNGAHKEGWKWRAELKSAKILSDFDSKGSVGSVFVNFKGLNLGLDSYRCNHLFSFVFRRVAAGSSGVYQEKDLRVRSLG